MAAAPPADAPPLTAPPYDAPQGFADSHAGPRPIAASGVASSAAARYDGPSPALAFILGMIPGVGAIYNGQYAKGLIHAVVFGIFISILNSHPPHGLEPMVGLLMAVWFFYMAFEAYHTARKRRDGERVEEFSSLIDFHHTTGRFPVGAVVLIALGTLLLLDQMDIMPLGRLIQFWPVGLILLGVYMLYSRISGGLRTDIHTGEPTRERR